MGYRETVLDTVHRPLCMTRCTNRPTASRETFHGPRREPIHDPGQDRRVNHEPIHTLVQSTSWYGLWRARALLRATSMELHGVLWRPMTVPWTEPRHARKTLKNKRHPNLIMGSHEGPMGSRGISSISYNNNLSVFVNVYK